MDYGLLLLNHKRNIQAILIKVNFRICALISVGYLRLNTVLLGNLSVESCLKLLMYLYTALKSAVISNNNSIRYNNINKLKNWLFQ